MTKKKFSLIIASLLVVALLVPLAVKTGLTEAVTRGSSSSSSSSANITFYNTKDDLVQLRVTKKVTASDEFHLPPTGDDAPAFDFYLYKQVADNVWEVAENQRYTLKDEDGPLYLYDESEGFTHEKDDNRLQLSIATDEYGKFSLKDGQTAIFPELAQGDRFKVVERDILSGYELQPPADPEEGLTATLTSEGASLTFENRYTVGPMQVHKRISYPDGFEQPESPDFTFMIEAPAQEDNPWANAEYTIFDEESGTKKGTGATDADGKFTLKGDTYAEFANVPLDVDYLVKELLDDGSSWRVVGKAEKEGTTGTEPGQGPVITFTNIEAAFGVTKTMVGALEVEEPFTFQVTDEYGQAINKTLTYYLYDKNKKLIENPNATGDDPYLYQCGADGTFTLHTRETAIFMGLAKDEKYGVRETDSGSYIQTTPRSAEGYLGEQVTDSVNILPFENDVPPYETSMSVQKKLSDQSEEGAAPNIEYTFRILKLEGEEYVPVPNAAYNITDGTGTRTLSADADGVFKIAAWETADFIGLDDKATYKIEEITDDLPEGYETPDDPVEDITIDGEVSPQMAFTNTFTGEESGGDSALGIAIRKENKKGELLEGAVLQLIAPGENGEETVVHEWTSSSVQAEPIDGIMPGHYLIREKEAPKGYEVAEDVSIEVLAATDGEDIQTFKMVDKKDTTVPTGIRILRSPVMRALIVMILLLAVACAYYYGNVKRRRNG